MKTTYFDQTMFSGMEIPLQKLMELNVKTIQSMSYVKPTDLANIKKPEELFEKNMSIFIQNSHMALNYMRDTFNILESHWLNVARDTQESARKTLSEVSSAVKKTTGQTASNVKKAVKKSASSFIKKSTTAAKKTAAKKSSTTTTMKKTASKATKKAASKTAKTAPKTTTLKKVVSKKAAPKKVAKMEKTARPAVSRSKSQKTMMSHKPTMSKTTHSSLSDSKVMAGKDNKHHMPGSSSMPKVGGLADKGNLKDLGLLHKPN